MTGKLTTRLGLDYRFRGNDGEKAGMTVGKPE